MLAQDLLFSGLKFGVGEYSRFMQLSELLQLRHIVRRKAARWCYCLWWRWSWLLVDWWRSLLLRILLLLHVIDLRVLLGICLLLLCGFLGRYDDPAASAAPPTTAVPTMAVFWSLA